jgi:hypothetical protein
MQIQNPGREHLSNCQSITSKRSPNFSQKWGFAWIIYAAHVQKIIGKDLRHNSYPKTTLYWNKNIGIQLAPFY